MFEAVTGFFSGMFASAWSVAAAAIIGVALISATAYGIYAYVKKSRAEAPAVAYVQDLGDIA